MAMKMLNDEDLNSVSGGSIVFNGDNSMCGLNCNNQCVVNDYDSVMQFIRENYTTMREADMMRAMVANGWLTRVG